MNTELIQKLKSQCIVREMRGTTAFNSYMVDRFDTEKFAELIVKECLSIVEPTEDSGDEWCVTLKGAAQEIKEHFGVEE